MSFTALDYGHLGRNEGLEALARAAGGVYLHLDREVARERLGEHLGAIIEPVLQDVRFLVDWGPAVIGAHRSGHHHHRLAGLGPDGPTALEPGARFVGTDLRAGQTAVVLYEVKLAEHAPADLGLFRVRSTPIHTGEPRIDERAIPAPIRPLSEASAELQLAVAATTFGELLGGACLPMPAEEILALAIRAQRPEYPQDAELVERLRLAIPLL